MQRYKLHFSIGSATFFSMDVQIDETEYIHGLPAGTSEKVIADNVGRHLAEKLDAKFLYAEYVE